MFGQAEKQEQIRRTEEQKNRGGKRTKRHFHDSKQLTIRMAILRNISNLPPRYKVILLFLFIFFRQRIPSHQTSLHSFDQFLFLLLWCY